MSKQVSLDRSLTPAFTTILAGGVAGMSEALVCHPLDTIKVRMQLSRRGNAVSAPGLVDTARNIVKSETMLGLYRGLGVVFVGIVPKMAIRFTSYEYYKGLLTNHETGKITRAGTFLAGLSAGVTEALIVVNPTEVLKIRIQAASRAPLKQASAQSEGLVSVIVNSIRSEGVGFLYRGATLTALRQGTNQAANFTTYTELKALLLRWQPQFKSQEHLPAYQTTVVGLISGAMGPLMNAPIDTIKTRLQQAPSPKGQSSWSHITSICTTTIQKEGVRSFWKGITPRIMRVAPGQAVTFTVYEYIRKRLEMI